MKKVEKGHPLFPGGIVSWEWIKKEGHSGNVEIENLKKNNNYPVLISAWFILEIIARKKGQ